MGRRKTSAEIFWLLIEYYRFFWTKISLGQGLFKVEEQHVSQLNTHANFLWQRIESSLVKCFEEPPDIFHSSPYSYVAQSRLKHYAITLLSR